MHLSESAAVELECEPAKGCCGSVLHSIRASKGKRAKEPLQLTCLDVPSSHAKNLTAARRRYNAISFLWLWRGGSHLESTSMRGQ